MSEQLLNRLQSAKRRYLLLESELDALLEFDFVALISRLRQELVQAQQKLGLLQSAADENAYAKFLAVLATSRTFCRRYKGDEQDLETLYQICMLLHGSGQLKLTEIRKMLEIRNLAGYLEVLRESGLVQRPSKQSKANTPHSLTQKGRALMKAFEPKDDK